jgi:uncharacterized membrane protein YoaK (UPF0700 family)
MFIPGGKPPLNLRTIPLIVLLCAMAGSIDAIAYLLEGQVFVANMTGNTVLFAISMLQHQFGKAALRGGLVLAFLAGVVVSRLLARSAGERVTSRQRIAVLGIQSVVLLVLGWKASAADTRLLLLLLAAILGVQNGAFRYIGGFQLNTTFVTGDLELLGEAIVDARNPRPKVSAFVLSWIGYAGGALLGALGTHEMPHHAFLVPMILAVISAVTMVLTPQAASRPAHS